MISSFAPLACPDNPLASSMFELAVVLSSKFTRIVTLPPVLPPANLGGILAQPDPVMPEIQNAGGGGLAPVDGGMNPIGGGMDPIADATVNEPYQMPQSRSFI